MNTLLALGRACVLGLVAVALPSWAAEKVGLITIHSVPATVIREAVQFEGVQGLGLQAEDLVETYPFATLTRIELNDGSVVDLGPSSRVLIKPRWTGAAGADGALIYVLDGWVKLSHPASAPPGKLVLASPHADLSKVAGNVVVRVHGPELALFAESGTVAGVLRKPGGVTTPIDIQSGGYLSRQPDGQERVMARPEPTFIQAVPRAFRDTLPARAEQLRGKEVQPGRGSRISYADVEGWLNAEPRVRARFVTRWRAMAQDAGFRQALIGQLAQHPEWRAVLFPPAPAPASALAATASHKPGTTAPAASSPHP